MSPRYIAYHNGVPYQEYVDPALVRHYRLVKKRRREYREAAWCLIALILSGPVFIFLLGLF